MIVREREPLAPRTTLGAGGSARYFVEARDLSELKEAFSFAAQENLRVLPFGNGSNILVPDNGVDGVVVQSVADKIRLEESEGVARIVADAGASWDRLVEEATARGMYGIENLAGIPGTVGGAAVQNIGAYGSELSTVFVSAECIDTRTGHAVTIDGEAAGFGYRRSIFKDHPELFITRVIIRVSEIGTPNLAYADLARARAEGVALGTPAEIAGAVRAIRSQKFPPRGTAGSFFKNPTLDAPVGEALKARFPDLPAYVQADGRRKVSLAWLLDHALGLKGYARGPVRLFERQPIVVVAETAATATAIDEFAREIETRVQNELGFAIEREVETFGSAKHDGA
ncbi:MAG TPA: UDP-N-acetylmuramate dehydrogenase [Candidatus Paceibacterota bacterium]|nr:UDP-N-acetylmuramate dehydrogenase [Candidatus Paceibacterota bacterium]